jgi:hypothetical protein
MQPRIVVRQEPGHLGGFRGRELGQDPLQVGERIDLDQATRSHDRVQHRGSPSRLRVPYVHPVCAEQRIVQEGSSPSDAQMRGVISESGGDASLAERANGMEKPTWARRRKPETDKADLNPKLKEVGGQGVRSDPESEGHEEKYRAVIDGGHPDDEPVGQRWKRSSLHWLGEGALIQPPNQGECGRHGTEERCVTSGGLTWSAGGTAVSDPISDQRNGKRCQDSRRTARVVPKKRGESRVTGMSDAESDDEASVMTGKLDGLGKARRTMMVGLRRKVSE